MTRQHTASIKEGSNFCNSQSRRQQVACAARVEYTCANNLSLDLRRQHRSTPLGQHAQQLEIESDLGPCTARLTALRVTAATATAAAAAPAHGVTQWTTTPHTQNLKLYTNHDL